MSTIEPYEVYAIKYAENLNSLKSQVFLGGDPHDGPIPLACAAHEGVVARLDLEPRFSAHNPQNQKPVISRGEAHA